MLSNLLNSSRKQTVGLAIRDGERHLSIMGCREQRRRVERCVTGAAPRR